MGGDLTRICVRPILGATSRDNALPASHVSPSSTTTAQERIHAAFVGFRVQEASCFGPDKNILFAAIETGFASLDEFNALCSAALVRALEHSATPLEAHVHQRQEAEEGSFTMAAGSHGRRSGGGRTGGGCAIGRGNSVLAWAAPSFKRAGTGSATKPQGSMAGFGPPVQV